MYSLQLILDSEPKSVFLIPTTISVLSIIRSHEPEIFYLRRSVYCDMVPFPDGPRQVFIVFRVWHLRNRRPHLKQTTHQKIPGLSQGWDTPGDTRRHRSPPLSSAVAYLRRRKGVPCRPAFLYTSFPTPSLMQSMSSLLQFIAIKTSDFGACDRLFPKSSKRIDSFPLVGIWASSGRVCSGVLGLLLFYSSAPIAMYIIWRIWLPSSLCSKNHSRDLFLSFLC